MALSAARVTRVFVAASIILAGAVATWHAMVTASLAKIGDGTNEFAANGTASGLANQANRAVLARDFAAALEPARQSLGIRPLNPGTLRNLALAQLETGDEDGFERSLTLASRLGWRDATTQLLLMQIATDAGDMRAAAIRFDALARQRFFPADTNAMMRRFVLAPGAPAALAERLAIHPAWREDYLLGTDLLTQEAYRPWLDMLTALRKAGPAAAPTPREYSVFERTLLVFGRVPLAIETSRKIGALSKRQADGFGIVKQGNGVSPFVWGIAPGREASVAQPQPGVVTVKTDGQSGGAMVQRLLPLKAGPHRLSVRVDSVSNDAERAFRWSVTCAQQTIELNSDASGATGGPGRLDMVAFVVPADCPAAQIALTSVAGQIRRDYSLTMADARLD